MNLNHEKAEPDMTQDNLEPSKPEAADASDAADLTVDSTDLLKNRKLLLIRHNGECYRLAITKTGKLILTK